MKDNYSFLKDELALMEIRKHKWLESEKLGQEIGFATAALDWIKKYGQDWKQGRFSAQDTSNVFSEKRRYRRFSRNFSVTLKTENDCVSGQTNDINLIGLACVVPVLISDRAGVEVTLNLTKDPRQAEQSMLKFRSRIIRASCVSQQGTSQTRCHIVLSLSEAIRDYLRANANLFLTVR